MNRNWYKGISQQMLPLGIALAGGVLLTSQQIVAQETSAEENNPPAAQETGDSSQYNDLSLPTAPAPAAYGVGIQGDMPVGSNTQNAISHPPGVVGGEQGFYPSLTVGYRWWTNPQRTEENEDTEDNSLLIQPMLVYRGSISGRHPYELSYSGSYDKFDEFSKLDYDQSVLGAALKLDTSEKTAVDLYGRYAEGRDERGASDARLVVSPEEENDKYERRTLGGRFTLGRRTNPLQIVLGTEYGEVDYKNNGQQLRDRDNNRLTAGVYWNITSKTSLFVDGSWNDINYQDSQVADSLDSEETNLSVGLGWEPSYATSLLVKAGNLKKEFDNDSRTDYDDLSYLAKLSWRPRDHIVVGFHASRNTEETTVPDSSYLLSDLVGVNLSYAFTPRVALSGFVNSIEDEYEGSREDEILGYGLGVSYNMTRWLSLGAGYRRTERTSSDAIAEYDSNSYSITATVRRQPTGKLGDPNIQTTEDLRSPRQ